MLSRNKGTHNNISFRTNNGVGQTMELKDTPIIQQTMDLFKVRLMYAKRSSVV